MKNYGFKSLCSCILLLVFIHASLAQNLVTNGDFETNFSDWNNLAGDGGSANYSIEQSDIQQGTKALKVLVNTLGSNSWSIQSIHDGWTAETGEEYKLTFYAKASTNLELRALQQNTTYSTQSYSLSNAWEPYEWSFTAKEDAMNLKFQYLEEGTYYLDDINIKKISQQSSDKDELLVDYETTYQTIEGFGASLAFYENWVPAHPNKEEMYNYAFNELGIDWLRIRNVYRYQNDFNPSSVEFVQKAAQYSNNSIKTLMCSWSPPADLKSNNDTHDGGTLRKENGEYVYNLFGDYWRDALDAYSSLGVNPDWISIQNEPDFSTPDWETCEFGSTESDTKAGYPEAFSAVANKISTLNNRPLMIGAEPLGIGFNNFAKYNTPLMNNSDLYGYAYHLYHGGDQDAPDSFIPTYQTIANEFGNKPNIMSEFSRGGWLETAWLINNAMVYANATAYFYWDLMWNNGGLIDMDNPWDQSQWENSKGYKLLPDYYSFKHFCAFVEPGNKRVEATNTNSALRTSMYINEDETELVAVIVNTGDNAITTTVNPASWTINSSDIFQSVEDNFFQTLGSLNDVNTLILPGKSITTIVLHGQPSVVLSTTKHLVITDNVSYPNPFRGTFQIEMEGPLEYKIYDMSGTVLEEGTEEMKDLAGKNLNPGIYLLNCFVNGKTTQSKIVKY